MKDFIYYASASLGPKEVRQFTKAINQPMDEFHRRVIVPQFYQPNEQLYLGLAVDPYLAGRNHRIAETMQGEPCAWSALTYFTNALSIPPAPTIIEGKEHWMSPMDRVVWGHSQVMTFEFDESDLDFFKKQLAWCRSSTGKLLDCAMGNLFRACSQWIDFEGIAVNYSGNKSFHIHIVFDTAQAIALGIADNVRAGLKQHWHRLLDTVMCELEPGVHPDMSMSEPEKFRRIPNGVRKLDKPNILGVPAGQYVPQVTIWEKFRDRAPKGATTMFFNPTLFVPRVIPPIHRPRASSILVPIGPELDYCREKMRAIFNDQTFPAFHDFVQRDDGIRAHFTNHAGDRHPASYMDADYRTVNINGSNPLGLTSSTAPRLPKPLRHMVEDWTAEFEQFNTRERSPVEHDFAMAVSDDASARREMARLLINVIRNEKLALICAPEGISKTTGLFDNHHRIDRWLKGQAQGAVMYAFAEYNAACDKAAEFNARQQARRHRAVVLESFDRAYANACSELGIKEISLQQLVVSGFPNRWAAIEALQPAVIEVFKRRHAEQLSEIGDSIAVYFTVHAVAHNWQLSSHSRMMWAPSFWALRGQNDHAKICREETKLNLLIHDEVKVENLVASYRSSKVKWVEALSSHDPHAWRAGSTAAERFKSFSAYRAHTPCTDSITFEEVQDIHGFAGHEWDQVLTRDSGEYGHLKMAYAEAIGKEWSIIERNWPTETSTRTIALTTEAVPVSIARRSVHDWSILDLDTPRVKAHFVETHARRGVTGKNLPKLCAEWQKSNPDLWIVSNKVGHLAKTMTHAAARGSNKLIGKDILQTITFMTPDEFEKLEALNAWTGLDSLIRQRHIDEFNQTAGRNLGFRKRGNARHYLLVNKALFDLLIGAPKARARYEMRVVPNRHQRAQARDHKLNGMKLTSRSRLKQMRIRLRKDRADEEIEPLISKAA